MSEGEGIWPDWWQSYFSSHYGVLYRGPLAGDLATDTEVGTLARLFARATSPLGDLGCGHGRHLLPLLKAGLPVVGLDYSPDLLAMCATRGRRVVARGDLRRLPFAPASLSGAWCLFNTFGYFTDEDNAAFLREVARVLQPGAAFVMDAPCRAGMRAVVRELPASTRIQRDMEIHEAWAVDDAGRRLLGRGTWLVKGDRKEWELSLRLYTPAEVERLLRRAGFEGPLEVRPLADFEHLGTRHPAPSATGSTWRRATNMAVLVRR